MGGSWLRLTLILIVVKLRYTAAITGGKLRGGSTRIMQQISPPAGTSDNVNFFAIPTVC